MTKEDLFKILIWDNLVRAALSRLFLLVPLLGWGPFGIVISHFAFKFADSLYDGTKEYIEITKIAMKNKEMEEAFNKASVKLYIIARDSGVESEAYRSAREEHKKSLSNLVRFGPARSA